MGRVEEGDQFLKAVKGVWEDHTGSMRKLKDVLKYMVSHPLLIMPTARTRCIHPQLRYP